LTSYDGLIMVNIEQHQVKNRELRYIHGTQGFVRTKGGWLLMPRQSIYALVDLYGFESARLMSSSTFGRCGIHIERKWNRAKITNRNETTAVLLREGDLVRLEVGNPNLDKKGVKVLHIGDKYLVLNKRKLLKTKGISYIDPRSDNIRSFFREVEIPETGLVLKPGNLFVGLTKETIKMKSGQHAHVFSHNPQVLKHLSSTFVHPGFNGKLAIEHLVTGRVRVKPGDEIALLQPFETGVVQMYKGRYQGQKSARPKKRSLKINNVKNK